MSKVNSLLIWEGFYFINLEGQIYPINNALHKKCSHNIDSSRSEIFILKTIIRDISHWSISLQKHSAKNLISSPELQAELTSSDSTLTMKGMVYFLQQLRRTVWLLWRLTIQSCYKLSISIMNHTRAIKLQMTRNLDRTCQTNIWII